MVPWYAELLNGGRVQIWFLCCRNLPRAGGENEWAEKFDASDDTRSVGVWRKALCMTRLVVPYFHHLRITHPKANTLLPIPYTGEKSLVLLLITQEQRHLTTTAQIEARTNTT